MFLIYSVVSARVHIKNLLIMSHDYFYAIKLKLVILSISFMYLGLGICVRVWVHTSSHFVNLRSVLLS